MNQETFSPPLNLELVVFDLDYTLWDAGGTWCDCLTPPFSKDGDARVLDDASRHIRLYPDILPIMQFLDTHEIPMGLASRTEEPDWARKLLALLGVRQRFKFQEIYPSQKRKHFAALKAASSYSYETMLFFDDEHRNIRDCSTLGVTCVEVSRGVYWEDLARGFQQMSAP